MFPNCLDQRKIVHRSSNQEVIFIINNNSIIPSAISKISIFRAGRLTPMLTLGVAHVEF